MKRNWELDELIEHFTLLPHELALIEYKLGETKLGFAALLKFFQYEARFPNNKFEIPKVVLAYIAKQLSLEPGVYAQYDWNGRTIKRHRVQIREYYGFRKATVEDVPRVTDWLCQHVLHHNQEFEYLKEAVYGYFRDLKVEPPTPDRVERLIRSAIHTYEEQFFQTTFQKLPVPSLAKLDVLIESITVLDDEEELEQHENRQISFNELKADPGRAGLESVLKEINKLRTIRNL